ncbi:hypothetical protein L7F22_045465 [Adiantum nelumboides]|nr:hypothetical protein [Adiantum nelumboides]
MLGIKHILGKERPLFAQSISIAKEVEDDEEESFLQANPGSNILQDSSLYNIKKLDGANFLLWKKQIWHILVQKKQLKPINLKEIKPKDMDKDKWNEMDELALSTIMLTLAKSVYFNVANEVSAYDAWTKLTGLYEKKSAASQVYWLKKLVDLKMKEGTPMSNHLNEFNTIYSQLSTQGVRFDKPVRAMFLLITLSESWDIFHTSLSNFAPPDGLTIAVLLKAIDGHALSNLIIDSRASLYVSPHREWFTSYVSTKDHV